MTEAPNCRAILREWRSNPHFSFPPPHERYNRLVRDLDANPAAARLVDGIIVRIGRGDAPADIDSWMVQFARRRGISLPAELSWLARPCRE